MFSGSLDGITSDWIEMEIKYEGSLNEETDKSLSELC